jgi:hypothetical protein
MPKNIEIYSPVSKPAFPLLPCNQKTTHHPGFMCGLTAMTPQHRLM